VQSVCVIRSSVQSFTSLLCKQCFQARIKAKPMIRTTFVPKNGLKSPGGAQMTHAGGFEQMAESSQQQQQQQQQYMAARPPPLAAFQPQPLPQAPKYVTPITPVTPLTPSFIQQPNVQFVHPQLQVRNMCYLYVYVFSTVYRYAMQESYCLSWL
jgi:hypothetical protein